MRLDDFFDCVDDSWRVSSSVSRRPNFGAVGFDSSRMLNELKFKL